MQIDILTAQPEHAVFAQAICDLMAESAKARGTGIATRKPDYVAEKLGSGKAVIALAGDELAGFSYIETWSHGRYVANSGLIVNPKFRRLGLARKIKAAVFNLSREKYPNAKIFGITTSLPVMKINSDLGYKRLLSGLLMIVLCNTQLFTGNTAFYTISLYEKKI